MSTNPQYGLFGKLPVHGDFVHRNLPSTFISCWDDWMQHYIAGSKEQLGEAWLDTYLTSPIWRFVFSSGVIDKNQWAGIMIPSVDQVGRYYPFSIVLPIANQFNLLEFISNNTDWYERIEELALQGLDGQFDIDELLIELDTIEFEFESNYQRAGNILDSDSIQINIMNEENAPSSVYAHLLESLHMQHYKSYSMWSTQGSEQVEPCVFSVQGLPDVGNIPAMLDGQWESWGWQQPYKLSAQDLTEQ